MILSPRPRRKTESHRDSHGQRLFQQPARRLRAIISAAFRFAIATAGATVGPVAPLKGSLMSPQVRAATLDLAEFGALLRAIDGYRSVLVRSTLQLTARLERRGIV